MTKLSNDTLNVLKNFATINSNLVIKPGEPLSTISEAKNIMAVAKIEEKFETGFGVYDLNEFISVFTLLGTPSLDFSEDSVLLEAGKSKVKYRFADQSILTSPTKTVNMPVADLEIDLSIDTLNQIRKAASALGHSIVSINGEDGVVSLSIVDPKNTTANTFSMVIDDANEQKASFDFQLLISNLKLMNGNYKVQISSKLITHWTNENFPIEYFIALEKTSTFDN